MTKGTSSASLREAPSPGGEGLRKGKKNPCADCYYFPSDYESHSCGIGCQYALVMSESRHHKIGSMLGIRDPLAPRLREELQRKPCRCYVPAQKRR